MLLPTLLIFSDVAWKFKCNTKTEAQVRLHHLYLQSCSDCWSTSPLGPYVSHWNFHLAPWSSSSTSHSSQCLKLTMSTSHEEDRRRYKKLQFMTCSPPCQQLCPQPGLQHFTFLTPARHLMELFSTPLTPEIEWEDPPPLSSSDPDSHGPWVRASIWMKNKSWSFIELWLCTECWIKHLHSNSTKQLISYIKMKRP